MSVASEFSEARRAVGTYGDRVAALSSVDELITPDGAPRDASADLAATIDLLGLPGLLARRAEAIRLVEDDGVTYGTALPSPDGSPVRGAPARWKLDPLPVVLDAQQWQALEPALAQRAQLLDLVLADLYGPRELLRRGVLPPELVFGHGEFLRAADGIRLPGPRQLFMTATDLVRDSAGSGWSVIGDRTQAPSGAGYAMENRRIVSRVMSGLYRDTRLERLRSFFHTVRAGLQEVAPATAEAPRVVLLTPGPGSETAFDQSFLSTLLGYPVVSGEDLTVREGRVFLRTLGRLEPVDVVLRRVDAGFADPLELRPDSALGVAGLMEACRLGNVSVVNTFGSGVLENPGLMPFLPAVSRMLLDEPLRLPSVQTWWCGDASSRSHVLARLDRLVIKPIARGVGRASVFGWELSAVRRDGLRRRIEAEPHAWSAQLPGEFSTAPVVTPRGLEPRRLLLRTFAVAQGGDYRFLAGGLARVAARPDSILVSNASGALAKDVWVLSPQEATAERWTTDVAPAALTALPPSKVAGPSSRVAEDLFWLGRYAERAEDVVRLLRVVDDLAEDWTARPETPGRQCLEVLLRALTRITTTYPGFVGAGADALLAAPHRELMSLVVDARRPGTLAHAVGHTVEAAHAVREQLSLDTWIVLGSLDRVLDELERGSQDGIERPLQPSLARILEGLLALAGLGAESMIRDAGWYYMDAGRRLERALQLVSLLRHALAEPAPPAVESLLLESVLIAGESIITHRRRQQGRAQLRTVLDLLITDRENPRSLGHQLERLADDLRHLPREQPGALVGAPLRDRMVAVNAVVREVDGSGGATLAASLDAVHIALSDLGIALGQAHFVHAAPQRAISGTPGWDT
ncbi:MAG TPA: circularly permuted type 2 ATP-grasp protein [Kineosporiaceae bacterium]|nr:circularly permuted type 2 ATP-grasp protein [Kineosporiaceae bacterium]